MSDPNNRAPFGQLDISKYLYILYLLCSQLSSEESVQISNDIFVMKVHYIYRVLVSNLQNVPGLTAYMHKCISGSHSLLSGSPAIFPITYCTCLSVYSLTCTAFMGPVSELKIIYICTYFDTYLCKCIYYASNIMTL